MTEERHDHEETANDRWIGAMMHVQRFDTPERVDMLVDRSVRSLRAESIAARRRTRSRESFQLVNARLVAVTWEKCPRMALALARSILRCNDQRFHACRSSFWR